jgi:hypothetical protein
MQEEDFAFLADPATLERALGLKELLDAFIQEAQHRFLQKLTAAMTKVQSQVDAGWSLDIDDGNSQMWLMPRPQSFIDRKLFAVVGFDPDIPSVIRPFWGIYDRGVPKRNLDLAEAAVAKVLSSSPIKASGYYSEYITDFPATGKDCLLAIIGENGDRLAERMASKALEIARALEVAFRE